MSPSVFLCAPCSSLSLAPPWPLHSFSIFCFLFFIYVFLSRLLFPLYFSLPPLHALPHPLALTPIPSPTPTPARASLRANPAASPAEEGSGSSSGASTSGQGDYHELVYGARVEVFNNGSLVFRNVQKSTEGQYLCQAHNGIGAGLSKVVYLTVNGESEGAPGVRRRRSRSRTGTP